MEMKVRRARTAAVAELAELLPNSNGISDFDHHAAALEMSVEVVEPAPLIDDHIVAGNLRQGQMGTMPGV